jgi:peptide/nickel transport system substrate-binding protein
VALAATAQGLVAFDAQGDIVPALAERWIVEDDGQSYIFRLRRLRWPDGSPVRAAEVARLLRQRVAASPLPFGPVTLDIRAMTDQVIEIRTASPQSHLLQLLAQPVMAVASRRGGTGPYRAARRPASLYLTPLPDPMVADGEDERDTRTIEPRDNRILRAQRAAMAIVRFQRGAADVVLGGRYQDLPLLQAARVRVSAIRPDPVNGLFGLALVGKTALLDKPDVREALSMAIDREALTRRLNLAGWSTGATILPRALDLSRPAAQPRWSDLPLAERRRFAAAVIARAGASAEPVRIALPAGSGSLLLYRSIASDLAAIGVPTRLVGWDAPAELRLVDEVAPYDSAIWYLSRIGCRTLPYCSADADARLHTALTTADDGRRAGLLGEAEVLTLAAGGYIPLGNPVRWSLVSGRLTGYRPSPRARHPLNELIADPN